jgi:integrase/recombinase XerD
LLPQSSGIAVGDRIRTLLRRYGIDGRPHDLRHSFATEAVDRSNGNIVLVSKLMRHAEVTTTMRYVRLDRSGHDLVDRLYGAA